jgi:hypothetical protein
VLPNFVRRQSRLPNVRDFGDQNISALTIGACNVLLLEDVIRFGLKKLDFA